MKYKEEDIVKFMYPAYLYPKMPNPTMLIGIVKKHYIRENSVLYIIKTFDTKYYGIPESDISRKANSSEEFVARMEN